MQLAIELGAAGYEEYVPKRCTTADSLAKFRRIQGIYRAPSIPPEHKVVDLRQQTSLVRPTWNTRTWVQYNNLLIGQLYDRDTDGGMLSILDIVQLSPATTSIGAGTRSTDMFRRLPFAGYWEILAVDTAQDLLVQVCRSIARPRAPDAIRFVSVRTGSPHARMMKAAEGLLRLDGYWTHSHSSLSGDWILIQTCETVAQLGDAHLFHWPSRTRVRVRSISVYMNSVANLCVFFLVMVQQSKPGWGCIWRDAAFTQSFQCLLERACHTPVRLTAFHWW